MSELATTFYLSMDNVDSARWWYSKVARQFPDGRATPRALYALAQIYDRDSTARGATGDSLRKELVARFPDSEFADEARRLLGLPVAARVADPAEVAYRRAEAALLSREFEKARKGYKAVVDSFPVSPFAARAQYAIGWMYENSLGKTDSAIVTYRRLVEKYPSSTFAQRVRPLLAEIEAFKKQKSLKDSLGVASDSLEEVPTRKLNKAVSDSLGRRVQKVVPEAKPLPTPEPLLP
jgi:tetratricopeptide (TPR) repeat protein